MGKLPLLTYAETFLMVAASSINAQQPTSRVIGFFRSGSASSVAAERETFLQALRDLGYIERSSLRVEYRYADGNPKQWLALAEDLVRNKVDVLVTAGIGPARAAKQATSAIPIVVGTAGDLVRTGLVVSLASPGGNLTA
jgi:putative ABC transport system substrate-binding protein